MSKKVWIIAEQRENSLKKVSFELLSKGQELAKKLNGELNAILIGNNIANLIAPLGHYGAQKVFVLEHPLLENYSTEGYVKVLYDLIKEHNPDIILAGATTNGKDFMPRLAALLNVGLASEAVDLELDANSELVFKRPIYAGKALIKVVCTDSPKMATVRPNVLNLATKDETRLAEVIKVNVQLAESDIRTKLKEVIKTVGATIDLTEADVVVSGGRGIKGPEYFETLKELANLLGGTIGASRAAVDAGWITHAFQVGQTGKVVSPNVYIACGLSGSIQHQAGMSSSKCIVGINKDPDAPIFKIADYGIVGDLFKVLPELIEKVKKMKS